MEGEESVAALSKLRRDLAITPCAVAVGARNIMKTLEYFNCDSKPPLQMCMSKLMG